MQFEGLGGVAILGALLLGIIITTIRRYNSKYWVRYKIKKGHHFSGSNDTYNPFRRIKINNPLSTVTSLHFQGWFDISALYLYDSSWDDLNKLYGLTFIKGVKTNVHSNSVRIAWRPNNEDCTIDLWGYIYCDGIRRWEYIGYVEPYEVFDVQITAFRNGTFWFKVTKGEELPMNLCMRSPKPYKIPLLQWIFMGINHPYFGGDNKSPHDIYMHIAKYKS